MASTLAPSHRLSSNAPITLEETGELVPSEGSLRISAPSGYQRCGGGLYYLFQGISGTPHPLLFNLHR